MQHDGPSHYRRRFRGILYTGVAVWWNKALPLVSIVVPFRGYLLKDP